MDDNLDLEYERLLGEGSYGKVFLVKQQDGQKFAVKEIDLQKCDETGREQAHREATILSGIQQENILKYIESVINEDCLYIITEFCGGGDLEDYIQMVSGHGLTIPEQVISEWILQLGDALNYLHGKKILHRDMKTKNIFLKEDLTVKLGDLGIAKVLDLNQSKADTFIGTPSYMSPELFMGKSYNHKTDIWGLGCCVYEMMTLKRAFQGKALWTIIREIKNGKVLELPDLYSLELRTLVQEMMSQKPEERPSARDIVQNDLLLYHRGESKDIFKTLPDPNQSKPETKRSSRNSASLSGSFNKMLRQKNSATDDKFRQSIASVCEKINTLNLTGNRTALEEFDTFVYKGDSDDEELEAQGTILDSSTLRQYTEQLDTFVFKGFSGSENNDSRWGTLRKKGGDDEENGEFDEQDADKTLLRQYSNTLEDIETENGGVESDEDGVEDEGLVGAFEDTLKETMKYKYRGLRDTLQILPDRKLRGSQSDSGEIKSPSKFEKSNSEEKPERRLQEHMKKRGLSLSSSMSSPGTLNHSSNMTSDPRLSKTLSPTGDGNPKPKMRTCDRIEQSAKLKSMSGKPVKQPRQAFIDTDKEELIGDPADHAQNVVSHLREKLTPYSEGEGIAGQGHNSDYLQAETQGSPGKGKKKKTGYLKKQSEARKKSVDTPAEKNDNGSDSDRNVTLFTRAQSASFSKGDDSDSPHTGLQNGCHGKDKLGSILNTLHQNICEEDANEQLVYIQRELTRGIGIDNLKRLLAVMGVVEDEKDIQFHATDILGPKLFEEYKLHLQVLHRLDRREPSERS